uniref:RIN4 pathogenic type III effector avirulence factor Avr cleavage site domain-containing protein n=1 Tax=Lactuca sativa TaxID=4236 RepID=A0A9R1UIB0_LACSA|nr:hypothetical protein LSAT_V11C900497650 [Lactuca sativa]
MAEKGPPLPKFGDWDVNDPASAEGFTVIFNKARNEKKTGGTSDSPPKNDSTYNKSGTATLGKPQSVSFFIHLMKECNCSFHSSLYSIPLFIPFHYMSIVFILQKKWFCCMA